MKGLIVKLASGRVTLMNSYASREREFSEPVPWFSHGNNIPLICFIVTENLMTNVAMGLAGKEAGTGLRRVNFSSIHKLSESVPTKVFVNGVSGNIKKVLEEKFIHGGVLTENGLRHVIDILLKISPDINAFISNFVKNLNGLLDRLSPRARMNLAFQKEAILTALLIAGPDFDRKQIQQWDPAGQPSSFLDGLKVQRLSEAQIIRYDSQNFPGFKAMAGSIRDTAIFRSQYEKLTVIYADKEPLEELTGADLIYYNETYKSFVFVQYKAMESDGYRLDKQLAREIARSEVLLSKCGIYTQKDCQSFRLHGNPFFIKLCPRPVFLPDSSALSQGMYIPLEYWKFLENSKQILGRKGGRIVNFDNVGRYFTNTDFAMLVSKAWVGSYPEQSILLGDMIKETLGAGRAAVYAIKERLRGRHSECTIREDE